MTDDEIAILAAGWEIHVVVTVSNPVTRYELAGRDFISMVAELRGVVDAVAQRSHAAGCIRCRVQ